MYPKRVNPQPSRFRACIVRLGVRGSGPGVRVQGQRVSYAVCSGGQLTLDATYVVDFFDVLTFVMC